VKLAFFFMGFAFLLLETKTVVQFSLLFGTTWFNASMVFLSVLILVLIANWLAYHIKPGKLWLLFILLFVFALLPVFYPMSNLLAIKSYFPRFVVASTLLALPIFFANLIFGITFRKQKLAENLFGWNLIGATLGGGAEYVSMLTGYNFLAIVVAAAYGLVFLLLRDAKRRPIA
jgi:hypothetical protein